ncbi:unnamed protein product [Caenorhabditis auriculariae]|uniref:Uncharacterized protein n=1 Tax=Caenorhabditis auriculariae TaxID=2777116 RepID=A0A8S1GUR7_9PELO|nr:unnamed protein product [Caenorhabditis auriculariae]
MVHCFELYLIIWKTPKFVQSKVPQIIRVFLLIPIDFFTQDGAVAFLYVPDLGDDWINENITLYGKEIYEVPARQQFWGLIFLSPINLAAILHIQYANLRCVTLDELKKPLWKYRLNVIFIYFISLIAGILIMAPTTRVEPAVRLFCLLFQYLYTLFYVGFALKFSWDIWQSFSPWKEVRVSENTRKMQRKIFLAIQVQSIHSDLRGEGKGIRTRNVRVRGINCFTMLEQYSAQLVQG